MIFITLSTPIKKTDDYANIYSVNSLYLVVNYPNGYLEEKNKNKHLFVEYITDKNKEVTIKYTELWDRNKNIIKAINGGKEIAYDKYFMSIKFNSENDLPLNKPLKFYAMTIVVRSVFEEHGKLHPQIYLYECLYEL